MLYSYKVIITVGFSVAMKQVVVLLTDSQKFVYYIK